MEFTNVVETRRSVREYDASRKVERSVVEEIIKEASYAPSWKNSQTARYHCIMSEDIIKEVEQECLPEFNAKNADGASAIIVTSFVNHRSGFERDGSKSNELGDGWGCYDLGLNNMIFLLKAHELGLSTLVMGLRDEKKIKELLNIGDEETIVSVIALGYSDVQPSMPRRKDVDSVAKFY